MLCLDLYPKQNHLKYHWTKTGIFNKTSPKLSDLKLLEIMYRSSTSMWSHLFYPFSHVDDCHNIFNCVH